ncbi:cyclodeaminase/cyclohydrolase family protein [Actinophytocola glycyrrhizae]|uniref:Cyclodeaminase/cyclohydrolase family protein n=1 Tax=Actinophytocola glycyrrhizae TaxID=2044873 RepID=A0ABV9SFQ3_9PSEU
MDDLSIISWLDSLAERTPAPGGGAAAAVNAAMSAALIGMVASYTTGKKWADRETRMRELNQEAEQLRKEALRLAEEDQHAFAKVGAAYGMPRETDEQKSDRREAIQSALIGAAEPPVAIAVLSRRLVELAGELVDGGNPNVVSDVAVAASNAHAALQAAVVNIEINAASIKDEDVVRGLRSTVEGCTATFAAAEDVVRRVRAVISA